MSKPYSPLCKEACLRIYGSNGRIHCLKYCIGNAIGGLSVGEPAEEMYAMTEVVTAILPKEKPRYLMGVGTPANILESIALG